MNHDLDQDNIEFGGPSQYSKKDSNKNNNQMFEKKNDNGMNQYIHD